MPRLQPPEGQITLRGAVNHLRARGLQISEGMIYKYLKAGRLKGYGPETRKQKFYSIKELDRIADEELGIGGREGRHLDLSFARTSLSDLESITEVSRKLFKLPHAPSIPTETRRTWLLKESRGHYVIKRPTGDVVAWLHIVALEEDTIHRYMNRELYGRDLLADDVQVYVPGQPQSCIVLSIGVDPDLDLKRPDGKRPVGSRCISIMLHGVSLDLSLLGLQGIIIDRLYAWSETKEGIMLCTRLGMQQYAQPVKPPHAPRRYTFYLDVQASTMPLVRGYQRALREWQALNTVVTVPKPRQSVQRGVSPSGSDESTITPAPRQKAVSRPSRASKEASTEEMKRTLTGKIASTKEALPAGYVPAEGFAKLHNISPTGMRKAIARGNITTQTGDWKRGKVPVKTALDAEGQHQFYEWWKQNPNFTPCEHCPHPTSKGECD